MNQMDFTPALGRPEMTGAYDLAIRMLTRERRWRLALLEKLAPREGDAILDGGCGTGTFALLVKKASPGARVGGLDPDPAVLEIAAAKARGAGVKIEWRRGFARDADRSGDPFTKVVSSLVFHQVPMEEKRRGIEAMARTVRSEEHTSELQSLIRISQADFCLKKKKKTITRRQKTQ